MYYAQNRVANQSDMMPGKPCDDSLAKYIRAMLALHVLTGKVRTYKKG